MSRPIVSFIIPVRNDAVRLRGCVESIRAARTPGPVEVIVGNNGSTDDPARAVAHLDATVLNLPVRRVSAVRNEAAARAAADLLAFVDADHLIGPEWITAALAATSAPDVVAAGADCHAPANGTWVQQMYDRLRRRTPTAQETDWLGSGNMVVRKAAFDAVGGFDMSLETCEDVDLCRRLRHAGGRIVATDAMYNVHLGDPPTLRALFFGELWRGRDNFKVSLRDRLTVRSALGLTVPLVYLVAMATLVFGIVAAPLGALAMALVLSGLVLLRAARMLRRDRRITPRLLLQALAVAVTYDVARSFALVTRAGHGLRRSGDK